ncbi:MAG: lytic transglycosylase domain-containing protein [Magnetococcales bacterium]|nr:lytic transglycosylase domain-containing protein [Magnetococcales bacterium]
MTALLLSALVLPLYATTVQADSPPMERLIHQVALQENLDPDLLRAVVAIESNFNMETVSEHGAVGLMQLMPATARTLGVKDIHNPEQNLRGGARYLKIMLKKFPNLSLALAAYNAGPTLVARHNGIPPLAETQRYVGKVLSHYNQSAKANKNKLKGGKNSLNGKLFRTDTRNQVAKNLHSGMKETPYPPQPTPMVSIYRTHSQVRHAIATADSALAKNSRSVQFAMALSDPTGGEAVQFIPASH